jgi:hypothetical protein
VIATLTWKFINGRKSTALAPLPPGPPADLIIGHVRMVPSSRPELVYQKWAKQYNSDVIYVNFLGQPVVILNSAQSAVDLLYVLEQILFRVFLFCLEYRQAVPNLSFEFLRLEQTLVPSFPGINEVPYSATVLASTSLKNPDGQASLP